MGNLFAELKRRNVFRVAIAYAVVGWLLVQITALAVPAFAMPLWVNTVVFYFVLLGFPLALLLAWAFELTPEGIRRSREVKRETSTTPSTGRKLDFIIIGALVLLVGFLLSDRFAQGPNTGEDGLAKASIAVLPFVNMSPDKDQEYFSDGISEELLNVLAQVPDLRVAARTSSFRFKGEARDIQDIARQLGVAHVLEGSVRKGGDTVRITAQLIDAGTGFHLWSATYDRELTDIFAIQDEISAAIVAALSETLGLTLPSAPKVQQTANSASYDEYLLGVLEMNSRNAASLEAAKGHFERALEIDPDYAPAHARLSITLGLLPLYNNRYTFEGMKEARAHHTERAMALAPDAPESLAAEGFHVWHNADSLRKASAIFERAVALNPSYTDVLNWLANISGQLGNHQARLDYLARALKIDPLNPLTIVSNAQFLLRNRRFDEARVLVERLRPLSPALYLGASGDFARRQGLHARAAIYYLEKLAIIPASNDERRDLAKTLAFGLGLGGETSRLDHSNWEVMISIGRIEQALSRARELAGSGEPNVMGPALLQAGRPEEAVGHLNQTWDKALADAAVDRIALGTLVDIGRIRQMTGDQAGGQKVLKAALEAIARQRAAGMNSNNLDWVEGMARYFLDQKEAGLRLVARGVVRGFVEYIMQPQYQPMTSDPGFAPILAAREAHAAAERDKFLTIVCNGGNPAPEVWTPKPEACAPFGKSAP